MNQFWKEKKKNSCLANGVALLSCSNYHFHLENIALRNASFNQLLQHILLVQPKTPRKIILRKDLGFVNILQLWREARSACRILAGKLLRLLSHIRDWEDEMIILRKKLRERGCEYGMTKWVHDQFQQLVLIHGPPLCSNSQSSCLQNGDVLCFLWGTNWIYICYVEESRPPLWSSGQSSCL
jgi:hypothetical protein